jgi:hypothetical protein
MLRRLALVVLTLWALPSSALANPSISVSSSAVGGLKSLPATVKHRLTLTAGATQETVGITTSGTLAVSGDTQAVGPQVAVGEPTFTCGGARWMRPHEPYGELARFSVTITLAPFATAFVDTTTTFTEPPWGADLLDATWHIAPAQGSAFDVVSAAPSPFYTGVSGVELEFALTRLSAGVYAVAGTAQPDIDSGHVELWGYPPGRTRAIRLAVVRLRAGAWSIPRLRPSRAGRWEFYARYRTAGKAYANDASICGTIVPITLRPTRAHAQ